MILSRLLIESTLYKPSFYRTILDYFILVLCVPITFILDIIFVIPEIIALILYRIIEGKEEE